MSLAVKCSHDTNELWFPVSFIEYFDHRRIFTKVCKVKKVLENHQYPSAFYEPLIDKALKKSYGKNKEDNDSEKN